MDCHTKSVAAYVSQSANFMEDFNCPGPSGELSCQCHPKMEDTHKEGRTSNGTKPRKKGLDAEALQNHFHHRPDAHDDATTP